MPSISALGSAKFEARSDSKGMRKKGHCGRKKGADVEGPHAPLQGRSQAPRTKRRAERGMTHTSEEHSFVPYKALSLSCEISQEPHCWAYTRVRMANLVLLLLRLTPFPCNRNPLIVPLGNGNCSYGCAYYTIRTKLWRTREHDNSKTGWNQVGVTTVMSSVTTILSGY